MAGDKSQTTDSTFSNYRETLRYQYPDACLAFYNISKPSMASSVVEQRSCPTECHLRWISISRGLSESAEAAAVLQAMDASRGANA